jgi:lipopolysaccharide biosynthesis protein
MSESGTVLPGSSVSGVSETINSTEFGTLCRIFIEHEGYTSDKWEHYLPIYEAAFSKFITCGQPIRLLEIGVQNGGSLQVWSKYLPRDSMIVGIDIDPACVRLAMGANISIRIGDATDPVALDHMLGDAKFDVIIDDGSHRSNHVIGTFKACFKRLSPGGIYVIEDLHCSYHASHGGGFRRAGTSIEWLKGLVDALNTDHFEGDAAAALDSTELQSLRKLGSRIAQITFFDSVAIVEKLASEKRQPYRRIRTGREVPIVDLAADIPLMPSAQLRTLLLSPSAAASFAPALLNAVASAREDVGELRAASERAEQRSAEAEIRLAEETRQRIDAGQRAEQAEKRLAEETRQRIDAGQRVAQAEKRLAEETRQRMGAEQRAAQLQADCDHFRSERDSVINSTFWRLAEPARRLATALPLGLRRQARRGARIAYWFLTPHRTRQRIAYLRSRLGVAPLADFFDAEWYRQRYEDVAASGLAPLEHFIRHGAAEGRDPSPLFDTSWYLEVNPDVAEAGVDPLLHYIEYGAAEGRDPSPLFDTSWYLEANPDVAAAGINPLLHYIKCGAAEGRDARAPLSQSQLVGESFVKYRLDKNGFVAVDDDIVVYLAYCPDGLLTPLQIRSIEAYAAEGYRIVLVVNSGTYNRMVDPGKTPAFIQIVRENIGFDFGGWAHAARLIGGLDLVHSVTFTNDSVVGPLSDQNSIKLRDRIEQIGADAVFMTECREVQKHFQSYFFVLNAQALAKGALKIMQAIPYLSDKERVILDQELPLSSRLEALGVSTKVAFPCPLADALSKNPTIHFWRTLIDAGFPFLKISLVTAGSVPIDSAELMEVLGAEWIEPLKGHIQRRTASETLRPLDANLPGRPAIAIEARFGQNGALQAYNPPSVQAPSVIVPLDDLEEAGPEEASGPAVLAAIHCFHLDEAEEILRDLGKLPLNLRSLLTTDTQEKAVRLEALLVRFALRGEVVVGPDRGRNLARLLIEAPRHLRGETILLHLHTKKSPHDPGLAGWARFLRQNLVGSPEIVRSILRLMEREEIGIVYSEHFDRVRGLRNWGYDFAHARRLMKRIGVTLTADSLLDFPTGAMFWAKTEALRPLFDLGLSYEDFEPDADQIDGTLAHAIERCILYVAEYQRFRHLRVIAHGQPAATAAISVSARDIGYMLRRHGPRLLGGAGARPSSYAAIGEIYPVNVARSAMSGGRLNIIVPTMKPAKIYGGLATAMRCARALFEAMRDTSQIRVIVTSEDVDTESMREIALRLGSSFALAEPNDDVEGMTLVDLHTRRYLPLTLRAGDVFFATAWWTADLAYRLHDRQAEMFGSAAKVVYLIQDYEPGFYEWSDRYALAQTTYAHGAVTIALLSSEELANFVTVRHHFAHAFHVPYAIDPEIMAHLKPTVKQKKIVAYGRPSAARNLFETIVEGVRTWQGRDPEANSAYTVAFRGEEFSGAHLAEIENARALGKNSLKEYAELLNEAAIGISLMLSPHPSYPPLDMATAGCVTISNSYEAKDLRGRANNLIPLDDVTPERLADALDAAVTRARFDVLTPLVTIRNIATEVPPVDYTILARLLSEGDSGWNLKRLISQA